MLYSDALSQGYWITEILMWSNFTITLTHQDAGEMVFQYAKTMARSLAVQSPVCLKLQYGIPCRGNLCL